MRKSRWLLGFAVATISIGGCKDAAEEQRIADRAECGHGEGKDSAKVKQIADIIDVPEFHDCQRFIVASPQGLVYDSLFAVYASQELPTLERRLGGVLTTDSAQTNIQPRPMQTNIQPRPIQTALAAVVHADGPYPRLGIMKGLNCLYMWRFVDGAQSPDTVWSARMLQDGTTRDCPDRLLSALPSGMNLRVDRRQIADFEKPSDYPPVARWDWDAGNRAQYIGVTCGAAWCEVYGGTTLNSSDSLPVEAGDSRDIRRVRLIKGWYDQQLLASYGTNGKLVPSQVMGTIVPDVKLGEFKIADFEERELHVADIGLVSALGPTDPVLVKYQQKFNFAATPVNKPGTMALSAPKPGGSLMWKASIVGPATPGAAIRAVKRRPVSTAFAANYRVPGVARWRWMRTDEGSWIRCDAGCCEMSNYIF